MKTLEVARSKIIIMLILSVALLVLLVVDSESYDLPKGHMILAATEMEFTDSYKTLFFVDEDGDYKCDYGVYLHEDLSRKEITSFKMSCKDIELTIKNWIEGR